MTDCVICNVCTKPGQIDDSPEINLIPSVVRKFQTEKFTVWRCSSCGSIHSKEGVDLDYYYKDYPLKQHKLDIWARAAYHNRFKRLIRQGMKPEHKILDFGCGQGLFVSFLLKKAYRNTVGYDPYFLKFSDNRVLDRTYDIVIAQDVIEHDEEPKEIMKQLVRCLRPGGILCIGTPNANMLDLRHPEKFVMSIHQPYHRHIFTEKALVQLGMNRGLNVEKIYRRYYYDTLYPSMNYRFLKTYIRRAGNLLDVAIEPSRVGMVLTSPLLLFYALFGYFFPPRSEMEIFFRRSHTQSQESQI